MDYLLVDPEGFSPRGTNLDGPFPGRSMGYSHRPPRYSFHFISFHFVSLALYLFHDRGRGIYRYLSCQGNLRYLALFYLRLEGISDYEGNHPVNHQNSLKSRPGDNKGIKYHRWLYWHTIITGNYCFENVK